MQERKILYGVIIDEYLLRNIFYTVGIPCNCSGYRYIKSALLLAASEGDHVLFNTTNALYPRLAEEYNVSSMSVERAIRYSIERVFNNDYNTETIELIFRNTYSPKGRPSNSRFLIALAEYTKWYLHKKRTKHSDEYM